MCFESRNLYKRQVGDDAWAKVCSGKLFVVCRNLEMSSRYFIVKIFIFIWILKKNQLGVGMVHEFGHALQSPWIYFGFQNWIPKMQFLIVRNPRHHCQLKSNFLAMKWNAKCFHFAALYVTLVFHLVRSCPSMHIKFYCMFLLILHTLLVHSENPAILITSPFAKHKTHSWNIQISCLLW